VFRLAWYIRLIRFEDSIRKRIGRPIRFEIPFEREKNDSQGPSFNRRFNMMSSKQLALSFSNVYFVITVVNEFCRLLHEQTGISNLLELQKYSLKRSQIV